MPAAILGATTLPGGGRSNINLFSSPPSNPRINDPHAPKPPPFPHIPRHRRRPPLNKPPNPNPNPSSPALKTIHSRTKYYKPVPRDAVLSDDGGRSVVVGENGVSYLLPGAPFEFQYSYSETPKVKPLAMREPDFLPFAPPTMNRPWTGKAPLKSKKEKALKKQRKVRVVGVEEGREEEEEGNGVGKKVMEMVRPVDGLVQRAADGRSREEILGRPLTRVEIKRLLKPCISSNRQINLGRDGLTHNMLESIHCHWKHRPICKVRCRGVPTVDMDNVCYHLEEKTGGKIIHRSGGVVYLFRGRNYDPATRSRFPVMLWKPAAPVYPKLIQEAPEGLTKKEAYDLREKGRKLLPICKLAKNGIYLNLVKDVRDAFEECSLVKINCRGLDPSDYKRIGAKLKDLVPCILLSFDDEQILMWQGKNWKSRYLKPWNLDSSRRSADGGSDSTTSDNSEKSSISSIQAARKEICSPRMLRLWNRAIESKKGMLIDATVLSPDALLEKVEEFSSISQAIEHSQPALILPASNEVHLLEEQLDEDKLEKTDKVHVYNDYYDGDDDADSLGELDPTVPIGSLPLDTLAMQLNPE